MELLKEGDYMYRLVDVYEIEENSSCDDCNQEWKLDDGTVLDQEDQDALNDAFGSYTNDDGVTLEERIKEIQEHQDTLNDAMLNMVNEDGMTLKQVWDKEIEENK